MGLAELLAAYNAAHGPDPAAVTRSPDGVLVLLSGELDMRVSNDLAPILDAALQDCSPGGRLLLDLSKVTYIASMGVGLLTNLMGKAERQSIRLVLVDIPPRVRKIMEVLGLMAFFNEERREGVEPP